MNNLTYNRNGKVYEFEMNNDSDYINRAAEMLGMKPTTLLYLLQYGWAQSLQDSIAGLAKKVAEENGDVEQAIDGQLNKRLDAILSGSIAVRGQNESRDPLKAIAKEMAKKGYFKIIGDKTHQHHERFVSMDKKDAVELLTEMFLKQKTRVQAEFDRRKALELDIDLDV